MREEDGYKQVKKSLFSIRTYIVFFLNISFVVFCSFLLFFSGYDIPEEVILNRIPKTFVNVMFLSFLACLVDGVRRRYTIERPVRRILNATQRIREGDFEARIKPLRISGKMNEFDVIIQNFNVMADELSGIETLRTDFIANVSHELKTPLAVIENYSTMVQNSTLSEEERREYAKSISGAARRLSNLITNILKLNRLEKQQIFPEIREYNLGEQLCECMLHFENVWEEKQLEIDTDIEENLTIQADPEILSLVWNNLFSNAIKFTEPKGKVFIGLQKEGEFVLVKVSDTGCGISTEIGRHIFEKFYQGDISHATQGNGLGLALVKRVMDITCGDISVESELGKGSTFIVRLRRA